MRADGNCLFRAVADQVEGDERYHPEYRRLTVEYMKKNPSQFKPFLDEDEPFDEYVEFVAQNKTWGGNLEIQAMSMRFKLNFIIHQKDAPNIEMKNFPSKDAKTVHISFHMNEHYNSVRLLDDHGERTLRPPLPIPEESKIADDDGSIPHEHPHKEPVYKDTYHQSHAPKRTVEIDVVKVVP